MNHMQFRDYIFDHNPGSITLRERERTVTHVRPGTGDASQYLGTQGRTVTCKGAFFGTSYGEAASSLQRFRAAACGGATGLLFLPGMEPFPGRLNDFAFEAQGDGCIIPYTMVFDEVLP